MSGADPKPVTVPPETHNSSAVPKQKEDIDQFDEWTLEAHGLLDKGVSVKLLRATKDKSGWTRLGDILKDLGPPVTGIASIVITLIVFYYGHKITKRQAETQAESLKAQAATQQAQANTAAKDLQLRIGSEFSKSLTELSSPDKKTRTQAAIRFAQYQDDAIQAIKPALGVDEDDVRRGAVTVIAQLFESEAVQHEVLLKSLSADFVKTGNPYLRLGILECFIQVNRRFSPSEASQITTLITSSLNPAVGCTRPGEEEMLRQGAVFLSLWPSHESAKLLLAIAKNTTCARAQIQALDNLPKAVRTLPPDERKIIEDELRTLIPDAEKIQKPGSDRRQATRKNG